MKVLQSPLLPTILGLRFGDFFHLPGKSINQSGNQNAPRLSLGFLLFRPFLEGKQFCFREKNKKQNRKSRSITLCYLLRVTTYIASTDKDLVRNKAKPRNGKNLFLFSDDNICFQKDDRLRKCFNSSSKWEKEGEDAVLCGFGSIRAVPRQPTLLCEHFSLSFACFSHRKAEKSETEDELKK